MQLGCAPLTPAERQRRVHENLCLYCGESNHLLTRYPIRPRRRGDHSPSTSAQISTCTFLNITKRQFSIPAPLSANGVTQIVEGLMDSGAAGNLIDEQLSQRLRVKLILVNPPFRINALDGQPLGTGRDSHDQKFHPSDWPPSILGHSVIGVVFT